MPLPTSAPRRVRAAPFAWVAVAAVVVAVAVVAATAPANWLAQWLARETHGVVVLADAQGTVWSGTAVVAVGSAQDEGPEGSVPPLRFALPGRVTWTLEGVTTLAPVLLLTHDGVLLRPIALRWTGGGVAVDPGAATVPAALLQLAGAPLNTVMPEGRCELRWDALRFAADGGAIGAGTLRVGALALALSPVRPLGDYLVTWTSDGRTLTWRLATEHGPLALDGGGVVGGGRTRVDVTARAAADAPAAVAAQLVPLLDMIGRRTPTEAVIQIGVT